MSGVQRIQVASISDLHLEPMSIIHDSLVILQFLYSVQESMVANWAGVRRLCERTKLFQMTLAEYERTRQNNDFSDGMHKALASLHDCLRQISDFVKEFTGQEDANEKKKLNFRDAMRRMMNFNSYNLRVCELNAYLDECVRDLNLVHSLDSESRRREDFKDIVDSLKDYVSTSIERIDTTTSQSRDQKELQAQAFTKLQEEIKSYKETIPNVFQTQFNQELSPQEVESLSDEVRFLETQALVRHNEIMSSLDDIKNHMFKLRKDVSFALRNNQRLNPQQQKERQAKLLHLEISLKELTVEKELCLGKGKFGDIFAGVFGTYNVAVKVFPRTTTMGHEDRIKNSVILLDDLKNNRHVIQCYGFCNDAGSLQIVYELAQYGSLTSIVGGHTSFPSLPTSLQVAWLSDIIDAIAHLHSWSVKHRDITPHNFMLFTSLVVKIGGLDLAKEQDNDTTRDSVLGMMEENYSAPELHRGGNSEFASDVYSFGMLGVYMFTRKSPNPSDPSVQVRNALKQIANETARAELESLLLDCVKDEPGCTDLNRLRPTADDVKDRIAKILKLLNGDPRGRGNREIDTIENVARDISIGRGIKQTLHVKPTIDEAKLRRLREDKVTGIMPSRLLAKGEYTCAELKEVFTLYELMEDQIDLAELLNAGYSLHEFKSVSCKPALLRAAGVPPQDLVAAGYDRPEVYTVLELMEDGISLQNLKERIGFSLIQMKEAGLSVNDLVTAGWNTEDLLEYYGVDELHNAGVSSVALKRAGRSYFTQVTCGILVKEMLEEGAKLTNILGDNVGLADIKAADVKVSDILAAGFSYSRTRELLGVGYTFGELRSAGVPLKEVLPEFGIRNKGRRKTMDLVTSIVSGGRSGKHASGMDSSIDVDLRAVVAGGYRADDFRDTGILIDDFLDSQFTVLEIYQLGFTVNELKSAGVQLESIHKVASEIPLANVLAAGYGIHDIWYCGWTVTELASCGISLKDMKAQNIALEDIRDASYTVSQVVAVGYKLNELLPVYTTVNLLSGGFTVKDLRKANVPASRIVNENSATVQQMREGGYNSLEIVEADVPVSTVRAGGFSVSDMKKDHVPTVTLRAGGVNANDMRDAGYTVQELLDVGYSIIELTDGGFSTKDLKNAHVAPTNLKSAGLSAQELKKGGYKVSDLIASSYTVAEIVEGGYTIKELKGIGLTVPDIKPADVSVKDLLDSGYKLQEVVNAGYPLEEIKASGVVQLANLAKCAGVALPSLVGVGYTASDFRNASIAPKALLAAEISINTLLTIGYSVKEIKSAGKKAQDFCNARVPIKEICSDFSAGEAFFGGYMVKDLATVFEIKEIKAANIPVIQIYQGEIKAQTLLQNNYKVIDLFNGGYSVKDLLNAGATCKDFLTAKLPLNEVIIALPGSNATKVRMLKEGGYKLTDLRPHFYAADFLSCGYTVRELKSVGTTVHDLKQANVNVRDLIEGGFKPQNVVDAKYSLTDIKASSAITLAVLAKCNGVSYMQLIDAQYIATDFKAAGITAKTLCHTAGVPIDVMLSTGFTVRELKGVNKLARDFMQARVPLLTVINDFTAAELIGGGYNPVEIIKTRNFKLSELRKVIAITPAHLRDGGISISDMKANGYTLVEMLHSKIPINELIAGGLTVSQLKAGGVTPEQLVAAGVDRQAAQASGSGCCIIS